MRDEIEIGQADETGGGRRKERAERLRQILTELQINPGLKLVSLAETLNVSTETIRRDLNKLSRQGLINRTYGGATVVHGSDLPFSERLSAHKKERRAIVKRALTMVKSGEVLAFGPGVTMLEFAKQAATELTNTIVMTNDFRVATTMGASDRNRVIMLPGDFERQESIVHGPETLAFMSRFRVGKVFFSSSGLTENGPNEADSHIAWVVRKMIEQAQAVILLIDHHKFGEIRLEQLCELSDIDTIVTDMQPGEELSEAIRVAGVELIVAEDATADAFAD